MTRWECRWSDICVARLDGRICGLSSGEPRVLSYHPRERDSRPECYLEHVYFCTKFWNEYKPRVQYALQRIIARALRVKVAELIPQLDFALAMAIVHHDLGKLVEDYQQHDGGWKRHEIITAPIIYEALREACKSDFGEGLAAIVSSATYLHHEAIQVGSWKELRSPSLDYLSSLLRRSFKMIDASSIVVNVADATASKLGLKLNAGKLLARRVKGPIGSKDLLRGLGRIISFIDGSPIAPRLRLAVAGALLPLRVVDDKAARCGRRWST